MKLLLTTLITLCLILSNTVFADQATKQSSLAIDAVIQSAHLNEKRQLHIQLPESYYKNNTKSYPVLYVLDGAHLTAPAEFNQRFLASKQHIPEMILVSIPHTGERTRDYSPYFRHNNEHNLGTDNFLNFIKNELIPHVNDNYRTTDYRILAGHSKSGLFVLYSLIKQPDLFKARFAFSPSLHHTPKLQQDIEKFVQNTKQANGYLYTNVGGSEFFKIKDAINLAKSLFADHQIAGLRTFFDYNEFDGHQSTPNIGFHKAFKSLYKPRKLDFAYSSLSSDEVIKHFDQVSQEFGYSIKPKMRELDSMQRYYFSIEPNINVLKTIHEVMNYFYPEQGLVNNNSQFYINWLTYGAKSGFDYSIAKPDESVLLKLTYSYAVKGDLATALAVINIALASYPRSYKAVEYKAKILERQGNTRQALDFYKQALNLDTDKKQQDIALYKQKIKQLESHNSSKN